MSEKNILPGFIKKILGGFEESDRRVTSRKTKELLDEEKRMRQENLTADPFRSAAEMVKSKKKEKGKKTFYYRDKRCKTCVLTSRSHAFRSG